MDIKGFSIDSLFLIVDVETNGLPTKRNRHYSETDVWPRIVQMSWGIYDINGNTIKFEDHIIKPIGFTISKESEKIHNISQERALTEGVLLDDILDKFQTDLKMVNLKCIIAHNIKNIIQYTSF